MLNEGIRGEDAGEVAAEDTGEEAKDNPPTGDTGMEAEYFVFLTFES